MLLYGTLHAISMSFIPVWHKFYNIILSTVSGAKSIIIGMIRLRFSYQQITGFIYEREERK